MIHDALDHIARERIAERRRAADRHWLVATARRTRRSGTPTTPTVTASTGDLAVDLAALGFGAVEHEIARFVRQARTDGAAPELVAVLEDRHAPAVVRERAFARIAASLNHEAPAVRVAA